MSRCASRPVYHVKEKEVQIVEEKPKEEVKEAVLQEQIKQLTALCTSLTKQLTKAKKQLEKAKERVVNAKAAVKEASLAFKTAMNNFESSRKKSVQLAWKAITQASAAVNSSPMMNKLYFYAGGDDSHFGIGSDFDVGVASIQPTNTQFRMVAEAEAAILETERLMDFANDAKDVLDEETKKCEAAIEDFNDVKDEVDELNDELNAAQEKLRALEDQVSDSGKAAPKKRKVVKKKPSQNKAEVRFTPAAKEALVESLFHHLGGGR